MTFILGGVLRGLILLIPVLLCAGIAYRRNRPALGPGETGGLLLAGLLTALAALAASLPAASAADALILLLPGEAALPGIPLIRSFVAAALPEEGLKAAVIFFLLSRRTEEEKGIPARVLTGLMVGLGFALFENGLYLNSSADLLLARGVTALPLHAGLGGLLGRFSRSPRRQAASLGAAILVHGIYDSLPFFLGSLVPQMVIALPLLIGALFIRKEEPRRYQNPGGGSHETFSPGRRR